MANNRASVRAAFIAVTTLFFAWGFITSLIDPLVAAVKGIFVLSDTEAQLSAFAFFIAYGVVSFPAAVLIARVRAVPSILLALALMALACIVMLVAANMAIYAVVLLGLFVLASGITILQVAANPLAAALGPPEGSHFRLTLSQTFNSFGTFIGPWLGASLFLAGVEVNEGAALDAGVRAGALAGIDRAYFWICGLILLLLAFFWFSRRTVSAAAPEPNAASTGEVVDLIRRGLTSPIALTAILGLGVVIVAALNGWWPSALLAVLGTTFTLILLWQLGSATGSPWARYGGMAIFLYVGAEVAIGTQMALFLNSEAIWANSDAAFSVPFLGWVMGSDGVPGVSLQEAGRAVAFYWGGAMVGRAVGSILLTKFPAARLLALFAAVACVMCLYVVLVGGVSAGFVALAIGFFNSIMFPVIFTLTLERSSAREEATSGFLCTSIVGGAFLPLLVGVVSDAASYTFALIAPAVCYALILGFGIAARRTPAVARSPDEAAAAMSHGH
ncbi:MAG TPA: MFS transporter [Alteraurantiacibacter sp.]